MLTYNLQVCRKKFPTGRNKRKAPTSRRKSRRGWFLLTDLLFVDAEDNAQGVLHVKEDGEVPFGVLVWSTGLAPNPLVQSVTEVDKHEKTGRYAQDFATSLDLQSVIDPTP